MDRLKRFQRSWFVTVAYFLLSFMILAEAIELVRSTEQLESYELIFNISVSKPWKIFERFFLVIVFALGGLRSFNLRKEAKAKP